jgi:hypothetical protein
MRLKLKEKIMKERKSAPLGDMVIKENYDAESKTFSQGYFEVRDRDGNPTGELLEQYSVKVYLPDDVDEAGIGEPSIILKKDQFLDARALSQAEKERLPEHLKGKVVCKLNIAMNRKQYPKKVK